MKTRRAGRRHQRTANRADCDFARELAEDFLTQRPSEYIRERMWFATQPIEEPDDPKDLVATIEQIGGPERILFASDWPHHDFDHPRAIMKLPMSREAKRLIMGENALRLFNIPTPERVVAGTEA